MSVNAHDIDEMITMKMANDALTIRVSELLAENKRLKEFAKSALVLQSQGKGVRSGCDPQNLREAIVTGSGQSYTAESWLKKNHKDCTKGQLELMHKKIGGWSQYSMAKSKILLKYYIDNI